MNKLVVITNFLAFFVCFYFILFYLIRKLNANPDPEGKMNADPNQQPWLCGDASDIRLSKLPDTYPANYAAEPFKTEAGNFFDKIIK